LAAGQRYDTLPALFQSVLLIFIVFLMDAFAPLFAFVCCLCGQTLDGHKSFRALTIRTIP
jgi:hypothetical protein